MSKNYYINVTGGTGLNAALASFISWIKVNGDANGNKDYKFYVCSPYSDIFEACPYVDGVYNSQNLKDLIFDARDDEDSKLIVQRIYDTDEFIKKQVNYSQIWAKLMEIPFEDTENGTKVTSVLEPFIKYPHLKAQVNNVINQINTAGYKDFVLMQFTGGQSPLVQVPQSKNEKGEIFADWSKVPYNYNNEPLKRHYPIEKVQSFVDEFTKEHPNTAIILYQLPNEPAPNNKAVFRFVIPYLTYYELARLPNCKGAVTIDSSLQHFIAGVTKNVVIWGHSKPKNFGYSYNKNIEQKCRTDDLLYFSALGPSGARVDYINPAELLKEVNDYLFETKSK